MSWRSAELNEIVPVLSIVPANGSMAPSADRHVAGVLGDRRQIEHEVVCAKRCRIDAVYRDRLAVAERDHRIAIRVIDQVGLDVGEAA